MSKVVWKGSVLLAPAPAVLVSCGTLEKPNLLTVAWTGILNTQPPMTYISIRPERFSYPLIRESGEFVINLTTVALASAVDWCGVRSGKEYDKFSACGLTPVAASQVAAPLVAQCPVSLECRVRKVEELGTHHMFIADIVAVNIEHTLLDPAGKLRLERAGLLAYAHGDYFALGKRLGGFGDSVRKKPKTTANGAARRPSAVQKPTPKAKPKPKRYGGDR